jgi:hypothetical protein
VRSGAQAIGNWQENAELRAESARKAIPAGTAK